MRKGVLPANDFMTMLRPQSCFLIFVAVAATGIFGSCIREECQVPNGGYLFEIPVTLSPAKDTFRVGDTLSIVSEFSDDVFELNTARTYKLQDFIFDPGTGINKIDEKNSVSNISDNFDFWAPEGADYNLSYLGSEGGQYAVGQYVYENGHYRLEFKLGNYSG